MRIVFCLILATVCSVRARRITLTYARPVGDSEREAAHSVDSVSDPLTRARATVSSASLLQLKPPEDSIHPSILATQGSAVQSQLDERDAEEAFEVVLQAALLTLMSEAKAMAQALHDKKYHHGYYRAVKAERAAKAAEEAVKQAIAAASLKATVVGRDVVFKKILEHTDLDRHATLEELLHILESKVDQYTQKVEGNLRLFPAFVELQEFVHQMRDLQKKIRARKGQPFDCEFMTRVMLWIISITNKAMYFEYVMKCEAHSIKRACQKDIEQEMPIKMKSEIGLFGFLRDMSAMEDVLKQHEEARAFLKKAGIKVDI